MAGFVFMSFPVSGSASLILIQKLGLGPMKVLDQDLPRAKSFGLHNVIVAFLDQGVHLSLLRQKLEAYILKVGNTKAFQDELLLTLPSMSVGIGFVNRLIRLIHAFKLLNLLSSKAF